MYWTQFRHAANSFIIYFMVGYTINPLPKENIKSRIKLDLGTTEKKKKKSRYNILIWPVRIAISSPLHNFSYALVTFYGFTNLCGTQKIAMQLPLAELSSW